MTFLIAFIIWYILGIAINLNYAFLFSRDTLRLWKAKVSLILVSIIGPLTIFILFPILKNILDEFKRQNTEMNDFINQNF